MWKETDENIKWSLGGESDEEGRSMMLEALKQGSLAFMGNFKDGFYKTQEKEHVLALFDACCRENERDVYNIGRKYNSQPPI